MSTAQLKKAEIRQMFLEIGELWPTRLEVDDEKTFVMKTLGRRMRYLVDAFYVYVCVNVVIFETIPFMMSCYNIYTGANEYVFPFTLPGFWEVNTTTSFLITFVWECSASIPCQIYLYVPYDLMIVILTSNISVLFRIIQIDLMNAIQTIDDQKKKKQNLNIADPDSYEKLLKIVKTHQTLLRISGQLNNIFGLVIFVHVVFAAVVICFFGFLAVVNDDLAEKIIYLITVFNTVFTTFLLGLSGQLLIDSSSSVAEAAYHSLWYESDMKVKKLILFIMIRTRRETYLSALGFSDMTLKSFSKIMSTSWTYFSLLRQMYFQD